MRYDQQERKLKLEIQDLDIICFDLIQKALNTQYQKNSNFQIFEKACNPPRTLLAQELYVK